MKSPLINDQADKNALKILSDYELNKAYSDTLYDLDKAFLAVIDILLDDNKEESDNEEKAKEQSVPNVFKESSKSESAG